MNPQLLGTLRLKIIDELRAEIREREGVIADLTRDEEPRQPPETMGLMPFFHDERINGLQSTPRPVHGDAIAKARGKGHKLKLPTKGLHDKKRHRRTPGEIESLGAELLAYIAKHPGQRGEQIAAALDTTVSTMRKPMLALIAAKRIGTKGQRRGMTYFPKGRAK